MKQRLIQAEDIKQCLLYAGVEDKPITFLFSDAQVVNETMVEDLNNILNAGKGRRGGRAWTP